MSFDIIKERKIMILTKIPVKKKDDYYLVITDAYRVGGKVKRRTVRKVGYLSELKKEYEDPIAHFKEVAREMTEKKKETGGIENVKLDFSTIADPSSSFRTGNLVIQKLLGRFSLDYLFRKKRDETKIRCNLGKVFNFLVVNQILSPSSKLRAFGGQGEFYGIKNICLHDIYRSLQYIDGISTGIQAKVFEESGKIVGRNVSGVYYDCTNYYFEIEVEDEFRKFGFSKEHRPNPIVQMGLFADADGIPVCYDLFAGSRNEQTSMVPLEKKFLSTLSGSNLIVCADAGLCSANNKYFNSVGNRDYVFVQSLKKVKGYLDDEIFDPASKKWVAVGEKFRYFVRPINDDIKVTLAGRGAVSKRHEANIIVTYDRDFDDYLKSVRKKRVEKAMSIIRNPSKYNRETSKDGKQYIKDITYDKDGQIVEKKLFLDEGKIRAEEKYDGYYALITSLVDEDPAKVIRINKKRWAIEDCFRIMKSYLKARPVYLSREESIRTHFLVNFVSLTILKIIQKKLRESMPHEDTTIERIIDSLRMLQATKVTDQIYVNGNVDELALAICNAFDVDLSPKFLRKNYLNSLLN